MEQLLLKQNITVFTFKKSHNKHIHKGLNVRTVHIRRSRNNQHYALICTTPLFYILAPTYFGGCLPSSGSFLDPSELLEIQIKWVVYYIMCGYMSCVPDCCGSVCCTPQHHPFDMNLK
jgi:hypothetical protein